MKWHSSTSLNILYLFVLILINHSCNQAAKKNVEKHLDPSLLKTLSSSENAEITIDTDLELLLSNKDIDGKHFQPAHFTIKSNQQLIYSGDLKVRPRGITRRAYCSFPPIMIKTSKKELQKSNIGPSYNLKLVTHCKDSVQHNQWVLKEYLIYKMLNILTEQSFKAQQVEATYKDSNGSSPATTKKGFLIEPLEELSSRCNCPILDDQNAIKSIHKEQYKLITLFQYMVGNTDWNLSRRHNIRLLNCTPEYGPTPVPYDFDYSGFVNASYAKPHTMLPIKNVRERMLQWRGNVDEDFSNTVALFNNKKSAIFTLVQNENHLGQAEKKACIDYLEEFYTVISTPESIKKEIKKARSK